MLPSNDQLPCDFNLDSVEYRNGIGENPCVYIYSKVSIGIFKDVEE